MTETSGKPLGAMPDPLRREADRCVMCGMCLPHCPTYVQTRNEAESPRGRIALIRALGSGQLEPSAHLIDHLDSCLSCRACEKACPSEVPYGQLIDGARAAGAHRSSAIERLLLWLTARPARLRRAALLAYLGQRLHLDTLPAPALRRLRALAPRLPLPRRWRRLYPARGERRGRIALFIGCIGGLADRQTLQSAITLLSRLGYEVAVPPAQGCCGALHQHAGAAAQAGALARRNLAAFAADGADAIVHLASGCGAHLSEYTGLAALDAPDRERAAAFSARLRDISQFLCEIDWPESLRLKSLPARVAVHEPCTARNVLRQADKPYRLLAKIPGIELIPLPDNALCCGAAGGYMLDHPQMADALREAKLDGLAPLHASALVSSNIGCALHLAAGLRARGRAIEVLHPVTLLARQLVD